MWEVVEVTFLVFIWNDLFRLLQFFIVILSGDIVSFFLDVFIVTFIFVFSFRLYFIKIRFFLNIVYSLFNLAR